MEQGLPGKRRGAANARAYSLIGLRRPIDRGGRTPPAAAPFYGTLASLCVQLTTGLWRLGRGRRGRIDRDQRFLVRHGFVGPNLALLAPSRDASVLGSRLGHTQKKLPSVWVGGAKHEIDVGGSGARCINCIMGLQPGSASARIRKTNATMENCWVRGYMQ